MKWIILIAIAYMLWRMFESEKRKKQEKKQRDTERLVATGESAKDPICGTYVDIASAISVKDGTTVQYFCSYDCRDAFLKKQGRAMPPESLRSEVHEPECVERHEER